MTRKCYATECVRELGHEPAPHRSANGYEWASVYPRFACEPDESAGLAEGILGYYPCAECGHLHFAGADAGYVDCPIEGCDCKGQEDEPADELEARRLGPGERMVGRIRMYSAAWLTAALAVLVLPAAATSAAPPLVPPCAWLSNEATYPPFVAGLPVLTTGLEGVIPYGGITSPAPKIAPRCGKVGVA